jgi:hypothetical protein
MMAEEFRDFTWRDYRPDHQADPTPKGIPLEAFGMTPQKAGGLLCKAARKSKGGKSTAKPIASHGRK